MKKFLLIIDGPMGVGKTTAARILHEKIRQTAHIGLDQIKWLVSGFQRTPVQNEMTRAVVMVMAGEYLRQGISVILEQGMKKEQIAVYKKLAKRHKAKYFIFRLSASKEVLFERVRKRPSKSGRSKISDARLLRNYRFHLANRHTEGIEINAEKMIPEEIAKRILKELKAR